MKPNKKGYPYFFDSDFVVTMICFVLFGMFFVNSYRLEDSTSYMLPRILSIFGITIILMMIITAYFKTGAGKKKEKESKEEKTGIHVGYTIAFSAVYFFVIPLLGFILTTLLAIIAFSYLVKFQHRKLIVILAIIIPLILHLAFVTLLKASLPAGIIEKLIF